MISRRIGLTVAINTQSWFPKPCLECMLFGWACAPRNEAIEAPCTRLDALMFDYLPYDAAGVAGTAQGGTSGEQAFFVCVCVVAHLCAQPAWMSWLRLVSPHYCAYALPIPRHGVCARTHPIVAMNTQAFCPTLFTHDWERVGYNPFPLQILCTIWLKPNVWHYCLASVLQFPWCLGQNIIVSRLAWLLPWTPKLSAFLCAKQLAWVSHQHACTRKCIHMVMPFKLITFGLFLSSQLYFSLPQAHMLYAHICTMVPARTFTHRHNHAFMYMHTYAWSCMHT